MEFIEGGQVNDRDYMKKHDINVNEVTSYLFKCVTRVRKH